MTVKRVQETNIGVYVATSAGIPIDDGDGHFLTIDSIQHDRSRIELLHKTAESMGYEQVGHFFMDAVRKIDDDEWIIQQQRLEAGLTPDPYDIGEMIDAHKQAKND